MVGCSSKNSDTHPGRCKKINCLSGKKSILINWKKIYVPLEKNIRLATQVEKDQLSLEKHIRFPSQVEKNQLLLEKSQLFTYFPKLISQCYLTYSKSCI